MLRILASVVVGYIVLFLCLFALLTGAFLGLGTDRAFEPGSYQVAIIWILVSLVLSVVAAILGGFVSKAIARSPTGPKALAGLVLVLGLAMAARVAMTPSPPMDRPGELTNLEAMQQAQQPAWAAVLTSLLDAAGVLIGGRLKKP
ncbi:MAG TPA: hypothetical protein VHN15_08250 [Thermoanaerobaculia bacterium]|nr:hypothetical protein [Thermoanaerobaculia bacterium]